MKKGMLIMRDNMVFIKGQLSAREREAIRRAGFVWAWPACAWRRRIERARRADWRDWYLALMAGQVQPAPDQIEPGEWLAEATADLTSAAVRDMAEVMFEDSSCLDKGLGWIADELGIPEQTCRAWYAAGVRKGKRRPYSEVRNRALSYNDGEEER